MGRPIEDLTGQTFGRLKVVGLRKSVIVGTRTRLLFECLCRCNETVFLYSKSLKYGETKSCGCLRREMAAERLKHARAVKAAKDKQRKEVSQ
jgi:hypothetical protein